MIFITVTKPADLLQQGEAFRAPFLVVRWRSIDLPTTGENKIADARVSNRLLCGIPSRDKGARHLSRGFAHLGIRPRITDDARIDFASVYHDGVITDLWSVGIFRILEDADRKHDRGNSSVL